MRLKGRKGADQGVTFGSASKFLGCVWAWKSGDRATVLTQQPTGWEPNYSMSNTPRSYPAPGSSVALRPLALGSFGACVPALIRTHQMFPAKVQNGLRIKLSSSCLPLHPAKDDDLWHLAWCTAFMIESMYHVVSSISGHLM